MHRKPQIETNKSDLNLIKSWLKMHSSNNLYCIWKSIFKSSKNIFTNFRTLNSKSNLYCFVERVMIQSLNFRVVNEG